MVGFCIKEVCALAPSISTPEHWRLSRPLAHMDLSVKPGPFKRIPPMLGRRLSIGCKLALETGLALLENHDADAVVFSSRHAELKRNEKILEALSENRDVSPTDFMMSVHNAAAASLTIQQKLLKPSTSIAAGADSFHAGLLDAVSLLEDDKRSVLLVDFESDLPDRLGASFTPQLPSIAYAVAMLITPGRDFQIEYRYREKGGEPLLPSSLVFAENYYHEKPIFVTEGQHTDIVWRRK
jgi:hypothetical protein